MGKRRKKKITPEKRARRKAYRKMQHERRVAKECAGRIAKLERSDSDWRFVYEVYLDSNPWRKLRALVIARDGGCLACGSGEKLHCHHIHYRTLGAELGDELVTLCEACHKAEHRTASTLAARESAWTGLARVRGAVV
jgi:5-methylcytosine-specific restriction endonuclease McrA